jgi:predicted MFS family arabinose efflux permease
MGNSKQIFALGVAALLTVSSAGAWADENCKPKDWTAQLWDYSTVAGAAIGGAAVCGGLIISTLGVGTPGCVPVLAGVGGVAAYVALDNCDNSTK